MKIIFLCNRKDIYKERLGYLNAFNKLGVETIISGDVTHIGDLVSQQGDSILGIINPESATSIHPYDLLAFEIPTISFQIDTYSRVEQRAKAASLYDIQVVFHPGYERKFKDLGCRYPFLIGHAVDSTLMTVNECERIYDIGWVGRSDASFYSLRRKILKSLRQHFTTNNHERPCDWEEMMNIYHCSKIVVNISRDDFLQDANMRCFEALGARSLLITKLPSELSDLGFIEGEHFVGFESEQDLVEKIAYYLNNEDRRKEIADCGAALVMEKHTYEDRASQLISLMQDHGKHAMSKNPFRKASADVLVEQIAYNFWEDFALDKMLDALCESKSRPSLKSIVKAVFLFARKLKRVFT
jgi:hypothetical protein